MPGVHTRTHNYGVDANFPLDSPEAKKRACGVFHSLYLEVRVDTPSPNATVRGKRSPARCGCKCQFRGISDVLDEAFTEEFSTSS